MARRLDGLERAERERVIALHRAKAKELGVTITDAELGDLVGEHQLLLRLATDEELDEMERLLKAGDDAGLEVLLEAILARAHA